MKQTQTRLYALDVLRGITVAAMILVNNAGGKESFHFLQHSDWNGLTLCDMVFPSFLFIVGITTFISLRKTGFKWSNATFGKVVKRTIIILLIGWAIHWLEHICKGDFLPVANLRLTGVLPRIAICYFFTSVIAMTCSRKAIYCIITLLLLSYGAVLLLGNGLINDESNILSRVDRYLIGQEHLYTKRPIDPEGLLGTVGAIAYTLIGFCFGKIIADKQLSLDKRLLTIMVAGFSLYLIGYAIEQIVPLNKRVWTPSYTLVCSALAAMALGLVCYITDIKGKKRPFRFFDVFGVNPLFLYVLSEVVAIIISALKIKPVIYDALYCIIPQPHLASLAYSILFLIAMWGAGYPLFKKKIYIKI